MYSIFLFLKIESGIFEHFVTTYPLIQS